MNYTKIFLFLEKANASVLQSFLRAKYVLTLFYTSRWIKCILLVLRLGFNGEWSTPAGKILAGKVKMGNSVVAKCRENGATCVKEYEMLAGL